MIDVLCLCGFEIPKDNKNLLTLCSSAMFALKKPFCASLFKQASTAWGGVELRPCTWNIQDSSQLAFNER